MIMQQTLSESPMLIQDSKELEGIKQGEEEPTRLLNVLEIYNEAMSASTVSVGYDIILQKQVAIKKIIKKDLLHDFQMEQARREFDIHRQTSNDQIVKIFTAEETDKEFTLEMEFMNNANHFKEKIDDQLRFITREEKMKSYINDILVGLDHLHSQGLVHCDIKLENLFCEKSEGSLVRNVKIGDLGLVHIIDKNTGKTYMEQKCGTLSYIAPELQTNSYVDEKVDIWSLGIVLYKMSCAYKPTQILGYKYGQGPIPFRKADWRRRSKELQDIIVQMLEMEPSKRPSCKELMSHPWFETE